MRTRLLSIVSATVLVAPASAAAAPSIENFDIRPTCHGRTATLVGTRGNDRIRGEGDDVIVARGGDDKIRSGPGDDIICAGSGSDDVRGGIGFDEAWGAQGNDVIDLGGGFDSRTKDPYDAETPGGPSGSASGGPGRDRLMAFGQSLQLGGAGRDVLSGGDESDELWGGPGDDIVNGRSGDDQLFSDPGDDALDGSYGTDVLDLSSASQAINLDLTLGSVEGDGVDTVELIEQFKGTPLDDVMLGHESAIRFEGLDGNDVLMGGSSYDVLLGGPGDDSHIGGPGRDQALGAAGKDFFDLGQGTDEVSYEELDAPGDDGRGITADLATGTVEGAESETLIGVEDVIGSAFDDLLIGSELPNRLNGGGGDDDLQGAGGNDHLDGGPDDDLINGSDGNDHLQDSAGDDRYDGGVGTDTIAFSMAATANLLTGLASTSAGDDTLVAIESLYGSDSADNLTGDDSSNLIFGLDGDDDIYGLGGDDEIYGDTQPYSGSLDVYCPFVATAGNDEVHGGSGNDTITGDDWWGAPFCLPTGNGSSYIQGARDTLFGDAGDDTLLGAANDDKLDGGDDIDDLDGGDGSDRCLNWETRDSCEDERPRLSLPTDLGGTLAYAAADEIVTMRANGTDRKQLTDTDTDNYEPQWSSNGQQIAYTCMAGHWANSRKNEICIMDANGSNQRRLTFNDVADGEASWSPDGEWLVFIRFHGGPLDPDATEEIHKIRVDGTEEQRLTWNQAYEGSPAWSPDGTQIAFSTSDADHNIGIYTISPDGSDVQVLKDDPNEQEHEAVWAPNGGRIVYSAGHEIFISDLATGDTEKVGAGRSPDWSPDGEWIVYLPSDQASAFALTRVVDGATARLSHGTAYSPDWGP